MKKLYGFKCEESLIKELDKFLKKSSMDYMHRSHFIMDAISEKLKRENSNGK